MKRLGLLFILLLGRCLTAIVAVILTVLAYPIGYGLSMCIFLHEYFRKASAAIYEQQE